MQDLYNLYVGTCSVLPLNAMVDAAPWVHGLCVWASNLPFTATCYQSI